MRSLNVGLSNRFEQVMGIMTTPRFAAWLIALGLACTLPSATADKNIIFILADDLGWADTTLYGHTELYETPHLERLASRGMTFSRAYSNSPLCSPTRASVLTGQTPFRHGSTAPQHHTKEERLVAKVDLRAAPGDKALQVRSVNRLDSSWPTLGKQLQAAGWATGHFGKWHLGPEPFSPLQHGFDVDIPHWHGPGPAGWFVAPWSYADFEPNLPNEHIEDRMADEAVAWMGKQVAAGRPFYLNFWQFSVHAPFDAKRSLIDHYRVRVDLNQKQRSPTYAAMVHTLDAAVGRLLDFVDAAGIADETVIIFVSDNGGNTYNGIRETTLDGHEYLTPATSNHPLRGSKATIWEGGIRVPCVVVWPGLTAPHSRSSEMIQTSDFYPTLHANLGVEMPADHAVDGIDIAAALRGEELPDRPLFTYFPHFPKIDDWLPPSAAVHHENWKLIRLFHQGEEGAHQDLLFDLATDIWEQRNVAAQHPETAARLAGWLEDYILESSPVLPQPNPEFDSAAYRPEMIGVQPRGIKIGRQWRDRPDLLE